MVPVKKGTKWGVWGDPPCRFWHRNGTARQGATPTSPRTHLAVGFSSTVVTLFPKFVPAGLGNALETAIHATAPCRMDARADVRYPFGALTHTNKHKMEGSEGTSSSPAPAP